MSWSFTVLRGVEDPCTDTSYENERFIARWKYNDDFVDMSPFYPSLMKSVIAAARGDGCRLEERRN